MPLRLPAAHLPSPLQAHVTHPELNATFQLDIIGVKKNPNGQLFTGLGVLTKGTVIEVNVSECVAAAPRPLAFDPPADATPRVGWAWSRPPARWCGASTRR